MNIKRVLLLIVPLVFAVSIVFSVLIGTSLRRYQKAQSKTIVASQIAAEVFQRRLLADDYLQHPSDRAKVQWLARQQQVQALVQANADKFQTAEDKPYFAAIRQGLEGSAQTFQTIVDLYAPGLPLPSQQKKDLLVDELSIKAQETTSAASKLQEINNRRASTSLDDSLLFSLELAISFFAMLIISFYTIWRSAKRLQRQKAQDEAMLGSIGDGVFAVDHAGRIMLFNPVAEAMSGYTRAEALGRPYHDIFHFYSEQDGGTVEAFISTAMAGQKAAMSARTLLKRKDGTSMPVADSAAPILTEDGEVSGAVVVFRDTTQERQLERMKDEFLSIASHELRTPMGAIRATIAMILDGDYGKIPKELTEPLTDMKASTVRLVALVNDLLNVARIEAGRMKFAPRDLDIREVVRSVASTLLPLGREKGVQITVGTESSRQVQADPDKLGQVLTNLIGNALKFTDSGSITISVTAKTDAVEVSVTDTGIGIGAEDQQKLFGKFEQISSAQAGKPVGTGLGLYISRQIIRKMGGDLQLTASEPGKGSTFAFTLPMARTAAAIEVRKQLAREARAHPDQV